MKLSVFAVVVLLLQSSYCSRTLVSYAYFEGSALNAKNLKFFLTVGVKEREDVVFIFVVKGTFSAWIPKGLGPCSIEFPNYSNLLVVQAVNSAQCHDFDSFAIALANVDPNDYKYFVFINSSVRGPFLPSYLSGQDWVTLFTTQLTDDVKLVGTTVNCFYRIHLQSMFLVTDIVGLSHFYNRFRCYETKTQMIFEGEVMISQDLLAAGFNIKPMMLAYKDVDFRKLSPDDPMCFPNHDKFQDPYHEDAYFGVSISPVEVVFFKTNRNVTVDLLERYTDWALRQHVQ